MNGQTIAPPLMPVRLGADAHQPSLSAQSDGAVPVNNVYRSFG